MFMCVVRIVSYDFFQLKKREVRRMWFTRVVKER